MSVKKSKIPWTDQGWNPVTGCSKVSEGCKHCYAEREVETRWSKNPKSVFFGREFTDVQCHADQLAKPLHWKAPRKIFVCPRGDLFHESVPDEFIDQVFAVMALCPQHIFQVLTKRPERMMKYLSEYPGFRWINAIRKNHPPADGKGVLIHTTNGALPNVHLGVTVENQEAADARIPLLLQTPAAGRWVSVEPMLGFVDVDRAKGIVAHCRRDNWVPIDWVVCGGESGPNARPMSPDWARSLRDQCAAAGVPFLFKQWGEWLPMLGQRQGVAVGKKTTTPDGWVMGWAGTKAAGRLLDGVLHDEYPAVQP